MADLLNFALLLTSLTIPLGATDHGVYGQTYPIEEEDLIDYINRSIAKLDKSTLQERTFQQPKPVAGLKEAKTYMAYYFDPTIVAKADIKDDQGKIVVPKGTSYNPLEHFSLSQDLLFFDGEIEEHIQWAKSYKDTKWILVKGKPFTLEERENRPVFFDQFGSLVQKLSIKTIPAKVSQVGTKLIVESIPIQEVQCAS